MTEQVPPKKSVTFHLTYEELLRRKRGRYEHVIMLNPEQVIRDLSVDVNIEEPREITSLDVPALRFNASTLSEYTSGRLLKHSFLFDIVCLALNLIESPPNGFRRASGVILMQFTAFQHSFQIPHEY